MGILIAFLILSLWAAHLAYLLMFVEVSFAPDHADSYRHSNLFIYRAFHYRARCHARLGFVKPDSELDCWEICNLVFCGTLLFPASTRNTSCITNSPENLTDPDYYTGSQNFWRWWFSFLKNYVSWWQIITMAIIFNVLQIWINQFKTWLCLWIIPSMFWRPFNYFISELTSHIGCHIPNRC